MSLAARAVVALGWSTLARYNDLAGRLALEPLSATRTQLVDF
jgi:hypothetical protein